MIRVPTPYFIHFLRGIGKHNYLIVMTYNERLNVAIFLLALVNLNSTQGKAYISKSFSELEIDFDETLIYLKGLTLEKKFELYQSIKQMNSNEKKLIQQYFINAYLEGGSSGDQDKALILKEILTECEMFDNAI